MSELVRQAVQAVTGKVVERALANAPEIAPVAIGTPVSRVDGPLKVTGAATYASDTLLEGMVYAALTLSPIPRGRIISIDTSSAMALPGVIVIYTHQNAPRLGKNLMPQVGAGRWSIGRDFRPLQDDRIRFAGQPVALVIAETWEEVVAAASHVDVSYAAEPVETDLWQVEDDGFPATPRIGKPDYARGDVDAGLARAAARVSAEYATPPQTNNPLGLFATIAHWDGNQLTLYDANQATQNVAHAAEAVFGLTLGRGGVDVITPFVGGGFGAGLRAWPHAWLAAMAARAVGRPVKLVLNRREMFTAVGRRAQTIQQIEVGADADGRLTAIRHHALQDTSRDEDFVQAMTGVSRSLYACPNVETRYRLARLDRATPTYMRCPGEAESLFALECALDELAEKLGVDPVELRLRNDTDVDPEHDKPWSSRSLAACYQRGAELIGWPRRTPRPGSLRDGNTLIGLGTASATYPAFALPATAWARLDADGWLLVRSAATDIGPGTATAMTQVAADTLGLPIERVAFELGDSRFPRSPQQGGSMIMASVGPAVQAACLALKAQLVALAVADAASPLAGASANAIDAQDGVLVIRDDPSRSDPFAAILHRAGKTSLEAQQAAQSLPQRLTHACDAFGAQFAEVHVDADLRTIRVARLVGVFGAGRIINPKLARSQLMGGMIWGLSQALLEETVYDHRLGRIVNASFGDYLVPVSADMPEIEVDLIPEEDPYVNALGVKGVGEIGTAGVAPAIANAVYHATGTRVRELPITIEKLL